MRARMMACAIAACGLTGCGGGAMAPTASTQLQIGGTYQIVKTTIENTCDGNLTPSTVAATVAHTAGASTFRLNDSFTDFDGIVQATGSFTIASRATAPHLGAPVMTVFESGRFASGGFDAQVRLDIDGPLGQPPFAVCRVMQAWHAVKQGTPNVIPS